MTAANGDLDSLALINGKILTGTSFGSSLAIRGKRIASIDGPMPFDARRVDLRGRLVVPGFIDNHLHFFMGSRQLDEVPLRDAPSRAVFTERISDFTARRNAGAWITGGGWDEQRWDPPLLPTRHDLDRVSPHHPVFVTRLDLHMGVANTLALELAGVTRETPDPPGGSIGRDTDGEPTGLLRDTAMQFVRTVIPTASVGERADAIRRGLREAARHGVTSFCDMGLSAESFDDFRAFQRCAREGDLTARVWMYLPIRFWESLADLGVEKGFGSDRLHIGGLKGFSDGSLGSSTAAFREPYEGEPGNRGLLMHEMTDGSMAQWIREADEKELQLAIHAIGDRANDEVLSLFESRPRSRERRFRIEHAQHLDAGLIRRFATAGVIASAQPYHAADDGRWAHSKIGASRARGSFPFRSLLDAGVTVTFGSDWPVAPLNPIAGIHAAVTRRTIDGGHPRGWIPEEKISVTEALRAYTESNAWALFAEDEIGRIAPGMRADLVVLSDDLFTIAPDEIERVRVDMTIFDGDVIFDSLA